MNEISSVFERILAGSPEPPRRGVDEVLAHARRAYHRRNAIVGGALTGLTLVAALAVASTRLTGAPAPQVATPAAASASATPSTAAAPARLPSAAAVQAHDHQIYQALLAALPPGFGATPAQGGEPGSTMVLWEIGDTPGRYWSTTGVLVSDAAKTGSVSALILGDGAPAPTGDLCTAEIRTRLALYANPDGDCETVTIGGVPVRASTTPDRGSVVATRFLDGGYLSVRASRAVRPFQPGGDFNSLLWTGSGNSKPPLPASPLTARQAAALAAEPALLP